jgi:hypothetical protein
MVDLISFEEIAKKHTAGEYIAVGDDGREYPASYVPDYTPDGVMFFCIPASVSIKGYKAKPERHTFEAIVYAYFIAGMGMEPIAARRKVDNMTDKELEKFLD